MSPPDDASDLDGGGDRPTRLAEQLLVALAPILAALVALSAAPSADAAAAAVTASVLLTAGATAAASSLRTPGRSRLCLPRTGADVTA